MEDESRLVWQRAAASEHGASRGSCGSCGTVVFWDAPGTSTVSFAAETLSDGSGLEIAGHIWVGETEPTTTGVPIYGRGLPRSVVVPWRA